MLKLALQSLWARRLTAGLTLPGLATLVVDGNLGLVLGWLGHDLRVGASARTADHGPFVLDGRMSETEWTEVPVVEGRETDLETLRGQGRALRGQPGLAALAALPGAGGEAEDLDLHAATLQRAREDVGADRGDAALAPRAARPRRAALAAAW